MRKNQFTSCCYKCTERTITCHSTCEKYAEAKKKHHELTTKMINERIAGAYEYSRRRKSSDEATKFYQRTKGYRNTRK